MKSRLKDYSFTVRPLARQEGGGCLIEFPDLPGCISDGETREEAIRNGEDALKGYLLTLQEFGMAAPLRDTFYTRDLLRAPAPKV